MSVGATVSPELTDMKSSMKPTEKGTNLSGSPLPKLSPEQEGAQPPELLDLNMRASNIPSTSSFSKQKRSNMPTLTPKPNATSNTKPTENRGNQQDRNGRER